MSAYVAPVIAAPTMGPTMNNQIWATHVCLPCLDEPDTKPAS